MSADLLALPVSPLNSPGLLTAKGWDAVRHAGSVAVSCAHPGWVAQLREAGVEAVVLDMSSEGSLVDGLVRWVETSADAAPAHSASRPLVWLADSEHPFLPSPGVALSRLVEVLGEGVVEVDYVFASPVSPGQEVVESVRIMHELRSPGGDPWSAEQTHASLSRYLLEETYEVLQELERDEVVAADLVDELGDLLFQLVFHARIGMESADLWNLDSVARALNQKMYRRNPHVFSSQRENMAVDEIVAQWEQIKKTEKRRSTLSEGIPCALPALQRAFKIVSRAIAAGQLDGVEALIARCDDPYASKIMSIVVECAKSDADPESSVRSFLANSGL